MSEWLDWSSLSLVAVGDTNNTLVDGVAVEELTETQAHESVRVVRHWAGYWAGSAVRRLLPQRLDCLGELGDLDCDVSPRLLVAVEPLQELEDIALESGGTLTLFL